MSFSMSVVLKDVGGITRVAARGEATARDFPINQMHFDALLGADWASKRVVVSMDDVPYLDSAAIGWLITVHKQFKNAGGRLALYALQPAVKNVLTLLKVERVVPMFADAALAEKHLKKKVAEKAA